MCICMNWIQNDSNFFYLLQESSSESDSDQSTSSSCSSSTSSSAPLYTLRARSARTIKEKVENYDELINEAIRVNIIAFICL